MSRISHSHVYDSTLTITEIEGKSESISLRDARLV